MHTYIYIYVYIYLYILFSCCAGNLVPKLPPVPTLSPPHWSWVCLTLLINSRCTSPLPVLTTYNTTVSSGCSQLPVLPHIKVITSRQNKLPLLSLGLTSIGRHFVKKKKKRKKRKAVIKILVMRTEGWQKVATSINVIPQGKVKETTNREKND